MTEAARFDDAAGPPSRWFDDPVLREKAMRLFRDPKTAERRAALAHKREGREPESLSGLLERIEDATQD